MGSLKVFLINFLKNNGHYVFGSVFISKITGFLTSLIAIHLLSEQEFGLMSIVLSISLVFIALNGLGSNQIILRYGPLIEQVEEKKTFANYYLKDGFIKELILVIVFIFISIFYIQSYNDIFIVFLFFAFRLIGFYLFNHVQSQFRIEGDNRKFSKVCNVINISSLLLVLLLTYFFGLYGYLFALSFAPFLLVLFIDLKKNKRAIPNVFSLVELKKYGYFAILNAVFSDLLFSLDVILLGFLMSEVDVAYYRVALLIPANITFLTAIFMQSDYPIIAKNYLNKIFLKDYITNYYKLFIPITLLILIVGILAKDLILDLFFSANYENVGVAFSIALFGFSISMLTRNLYGNILSAIGLIKYNMISSVLVLIILTLSALLLVPMYGYLGMIISMSIGLLSSGLFLMYFFYSNFKKL